MRDALSDLYRYEIRRLRSELLAGRIVKRDYAPRVIELRQRYWLLSVPDRAVDKGRDLPCRTSKSSASSISGGRATPPASSPGAPVLYDSRDLVTHAVCVGMTGSGKTGLCISLIEEAAIDGVPVIAIDPKGDLGNLLLTFPKLRPQDFRPWIDEDEARRAGMTPDAYAAAQADVEEGAGRLG